jgi:acyl-CoA reductase-like NAD-dependent aldehyde dehydrogenase
MDTIRHYPMFIGGDWVDADERFEIRSPATDELVASVAKGSREHADRAIAAAKTAHADGRWRQMPPAERAGAESTDQAIRIAKDTEYGLSAGVWSTDNQRALEVAGQLEAGTVWINDWQRVNAAYAFGGYKQSGLRRELGPHALDEYTEEKSVHVGLSGRLDRWAYPLLLSTPPV